MARERLPDALGSREFGWLRRGANAFRGLAHEVASHWLARRLAREGRPRHSELSVVRSPREYSPAGESLVDVAMEAISAARIESLPELVERCSQQDLQRILTWPGEHYRLLPGLVLGTHSRCVIEIGTFEGHGALALASQAESVVTFDVVPWDSFPGSVLRLEDFSTSLRQALGDLSQPDVFNDYHQELAAADMIFIDGPKDGVFESRLWHLLSERFSGTGKFVVWDDTRVLHMVRLWDSIEVEKLDLTSFGHWSGTGICRL